MDAPFNTQGDEISDYGSDFTPDEQGIVNELLSKIPDAYTPAPTLVIENTDGYGRPQGSRTPRVLGRGNSRRTDSPSSYGPESVQMWAPVEGDGYQVLEAIVGNSATNNHKQQSASVESPPVSEPQDSDLRSPLERFRTKPQKALSVTDLVSPTWCELQYWYTLTKHGRKKRTPAMRQGSAVHKTLEEQVHQTVHIDTLTKEDAWGLRVWNIIQGLNTLRETGMTRELEVWGVVGGQVISGVIDELSYICPDRELEGEATARTAHEKRDKNAIAADQASITNFLKASGSQESPQGVMKSLRSMRRKTSKVYLTDVKTRGIKTIPKGAAFRPTLMQLMLYQLLLSELATNRVNADIIFTRYSLDSNANFSDSFIAQIGSLNETFYDAPSDPPQSSELRPSDQDPIQLLLNHNSLSSLWTLMIQEFQRTMPNGINSIGNVLKAEYRDQTDGTILGIKTFLYDRSVITEYVENEMRWWRGEREAQGVMIEEAYKCRICEFAEGCTWRKAKIEEATHVHRTRSRSVV